MFRSLLLILVLGGLALAQDAVSQMQDLLARGYYNSAAQINGPALVERFPDSSEAHYLYGLALFLTGNLAESRTQLDRALELLDTTPVAEYLHLEGLLLETEGDLDGGRSALQEAFLRTQRYDFAMDWARVAWQSGAYEEALAALLQAASTSQGRREPWPWLDQGRLLLFLGRYQEAITAFDTAVAVFEANDPGDLLPSPAYVEAFYRLGEIYERLDDLGEARINYQNALGGDPNYPPAIAALERLAQQGGN